MNQLILETLIVMMRAMLAAECADVEGFNSFVIPRADARLILDQIAKCKAALAEWGKRDG